MTNVSGPRPESRRPVGMPSQRMKLLAQDSADIKSCHILADPDREVLLSIKKVEYFLLRKLACHISSRSALLVSLNMVLHFMWTSVGFVDYGDKMSVGLPVEHTVQE